MTDRTLVDIECARLRFTPLAGPKEWAAGDFLKVYSDGTAEHASYNEYLAYMGLPPADNVELADAGYAPR